MAVVNGQVLLAGLYKLKPAYLYTAIHTHTNVTGNDEMKVKFAKDNRVKEAFMNTVLDVKSRGQMLKQTPIGISSQMYVSPLVIYKK